MTEVQNNGPDQLHPADGTATTELDGHVRLRIPRSGMAIETSPPISVPTLLHRTAKNYPNVTALAHKRNGTWITVTYREYEENVRTCAKAFLLLGLERHRSVCILGFNSPEWFYSCLGAIYAGGTAVGIYTTNSAEACFYNANHSDANIIVVEDEKQLEKIQCVRPKLPNLKAIIQYEGDSKSPDVLSWKTLMEIGRQQDDDLLESTLKSLTINECCTLVYTSGTVGNPKAVMLNHDNLTWQALAVSERMQIEPASEVLVSYLPLSHVAAQIVDIYIAITVAATVYFADKNALKGSLVNTLREVQPTTFLGVPRVWEKIHETMNQIGAQSGSVKKAIVTWAKAQALEHHLDRINGTNSNTWGYMLASSLLFKRIKQALGFGRCKLFASAAAPLSSDIKKYFMSVDIPIMEAFGMSEAGGAHIMCTAEAFGFDTLGITIPGTKTKIYNADEEGKGEICLYGRNIFMGYLLDKDNTDESLDRDGWLHSGDQGKIDEKGFVYITGRLKELLITAGGENIPPVPIEQNAKAELPQISNAFLVGDERKFLAMLVSLKTDVDPESGVPLETLRPEVQHWLKELECPASTVAQVLEAGPDQRVMNSLKEAIDRVNRKATSNAQRIQKVAILPADFSIATGELGPTMKVRRKYVINKYADLIEELYK